MNRAAELLNSFPDSLDDASDTDIDSPMSDAQPPQTPYQTIKDATEARLEARESAKYLLAKTFFDCREFDRCAAVFLPHSLPKAPLNTPSPASKNKQSAKGKAKPSTPTKPNVSIASTRNLSQKSLFLALYARFIAGERRMNEDSEMILGPQDGGVTTNKELIGISAILEEWFKNLATSGRQPQGWLEYLYGLVLAKSKNEELALQYLIESVNLCPYNWGAWQEMSDLFTSIEDVSFQI